MNIMTPEEFLMDYLLKCGLARYMPRRCSHGILMTEQCNACLKEYDRIRNAH